jgi:hypothetical protein
MNLLRRSLKDSLCISIWMPGSKFKDVSQSYMEIELGVSDRESGQEKSRPLWFVFENNSLYLLPVEGSDTEWYQNTLIEPAVKIYVDGQQYIGNSKPITDPNKVKEIVGKFVSKYGESEVNKYYKKFDVCVEFILQ